MTEAEARSFVQGKLDCMNKCDVFECKNTDECNSCNFCYAQGTFGEQMEAFSMAINALEKQIAKKPLHQGFVFACPCCNNEVTIGSTFLRPNQNHCAECGQKLDWSEV